MFPGSTPSFTTPTSAETLQAAGHTALHVAEEANIIAFSNKIGTGASTPTSGNVLVGTGTGTSGWQKLALGTNTSGVLPVNQGGTGSGSSTGTGSVVLQTSPTINNPTESNGTYSNATLPNPNITYNNNSIPAAAIVNNSLTISQMANGIAFPTITYNPYKFSVYRNGGWTAPNGTGLVTFDTELYDTSSNYSVSTGKFTAPIAGFYHFSAAVGVGTIVDGDGFAAYLYKNGSGVKTAYWAIGGTLAPFISISGDLELAANDYVQVYCTAIGNAGATGTQTFFDGFLVSTT